MNIIKYFFTLGLLLISNLLYSQHNNSQDLVVDTNIINVTVPSNMDINDKVYVENQSVCKIEHMVVTLRENNYLIPVGSASELNSGECVKIAEYEDNKLRKLRGKELAIKAKGICYTNDGTQNTTYKFRITLYEDRHDLHIKLTSYRNTKQTSTTNIMDF